MHAFYAFCGEGGKGQSVVKAHLYFCLILYINNDVSGQLILFSHSKRTLHSNY